MALSHQQAHDLIQRSLDGILSNQQRIALQGHLESCRECQAYADSLANLESRMRLVLGRRWPMPANTSQELSWVAANVKSKTTGLRPITRLTHQILRPAVSFGAIATLLALMAWAIGGISGRIGAPGETQTLVGAPSAIPLTSVTPVPSIQAGMCIVTMGTSVDLFDQPNMDSAAARSVEAEQVASVTGQYVDENSSVWLFVHYTDQVGWLASSEATTLSGACGQLPMFVHADDGRLITATAPAVVAISTRPSASAARPISTNRPVCDVVAPDDIPLYGGPDYNFSVVGTLSSGTQIPVLSWVRGSDTITWLNVGFDGASSGWVIWQNVDMAQLCPFVQEVTQLPATPTSSEPCVAEAVSDVPVFNGPAETFTQIGTISPGQVLLVTGQYYAINYGTWYQVSYQGGLGWLPSSIGENVYAGIKGNCVSVPFIDVKPPPATYTPTPDYLPSATPTPQPTSNATCTGTTTSDGIHVYDMPAFASSVVGTLNQGMSVTIVDAYYGGDANNWFKVEYAGGSGWIIGDFTVSLAGPCGNIAPTPIVSYSVPIDYTASVALAVGSTSQFSQSLPGANGDRAHVTAVKVEGIPTNNSDTSFYRTVRMHVGCTGDSASRLRWGYFGTTSLSWSCGQYVDVNMGMGWDSQYFVLEIPRDGSVTYTITLTVNPYAGP